MIRSALVVLRRLAVVTVVTAPLLVIASPAAAQQHSTVTDQGTPSALERGTHPLGTYGGGEIDAVNLFNGNLNLRVPLAGKDGRAGLGASVVLTYNSKTWRTEGVPLMDDTNNQAYLPFNESWDPTRTEIAYGWSLMPGRMAARSSGMSRPREDVMLCGPSPGRQTFLKSLTTVTFIAPDGTEYSFRDKMTNGQFHQVSTCTPFNRGRVWYTTDGTAATFISESDIVDVPIVDEAGARIVSGTVYLRDGTRFRVENGFTVWQEDRNGNRVNFDYTFSKNQDTWVVTDTLGRTITVAMFQPDLMSGEFVVATVTFRDASGTERVTTIYADYLRNARTDGSGDPTYGDLFGDNVSGFAIDDDHPFQPVVVTRVELPEVEPNERYAYAFRYNKYGEVTRVELPLGGRLEYAHGAGEGTGVNEYGVLANGNGLQIYRRVLNRATFVDTSTSDYATKTRYAESFMDALDLPQRKQSRVVEKFLNANGSTNAAVAHVFEGTPIDNYSRNYGVPTASGQKPWKEGKELRTEYLDNNGARLLREVENTWVQRAGTWLNSSNTDLNNFENDPRLARVDTKVVESGTTLVSKVTYAYDDDPDPVTHVHRRPWNNVSLIEEFDYGVNAPGPLLRQTARDYVTDQFYTNPVSELATSPDKEAIVHLRSLVKKEQIRDELGAVESETEYTYDEYSDVGYTKPLEGRSIAQNPDGTYRHVAIHSNRDARRGNVTTIRAKIDATRNAYTRHRYDVCGNVVKTFGPRSTDPASALHSTDYFYDSPGNALSFAYVTKVRRYVRREPAGTLITLDSQQTYHLETGQLASTTGENGEVTTYLYADALSRLTQVDLPTGGYNRVEYSLPSASSQTVTVFSKLDGTGTSTRETWTRTTYDGLGRQTFSSRSDVGLAEVSVETRYDVRSRPHLVSNPKRSTDPPNVLYRGWTRTTYDALGRVRYVDSLTDLGDTETSAGFTGRVTTKYDDDPYQNRPVVLVEDQAGKMRASVMDGLGRLTHVFEMRGLEVTDSNNYVTAYGYDARGNLLSVTQGTQQPRAFSYDALGRLVTATMPECKDAENSVEGTTTYQYDEAGNLEVKTDPRGVSITTTYDALNRPLAADYSDTTSASPDVEYVYEDSSLPSGVTGPSFGRLNTDGRLYAVITRQATERAQELTGVFYGYDASGRVINYSQMLGTSHYESAPGYNEASLLTSESYSFPGTSNLSRSFEYDDAGQVYRVKRGSAVMADDITYVPSGALGAQRLGPTNASTSLYHTIGYNSRLQTRSILLGTTAGAGDRLSLTYTYGTQPLATLPAGQRVNENANNGNVARIEIRPVPGQPYFEQNFAYDELNRLISAKEYRTTGGGTGCGGTTPPSAPTGLGATVTNDDVTLTWSDTSSDECSFVVMRGNTQGGPYPVTRVTAGPNVTTLADNDLASGTYYYRVVARNDAGDSALSNEVAVTIGCPTAPAAPSNLTATNVNGVQVNLSWVDTSTNEQKFVIERRDISNYQPYHEIAEKAANSTTHQDTGLVPFNTYQYRICAVGVDNCRSEWAESPEVTLLPPDQAIRVDGVNRYGAAEGSGAISGLNVTGTVTVEAWVVLYDTEVNDVILSKHAQGAAEGGFTLAVTESNQLAFTTFGSTGAVAASIVSSDTLQIKRWYHVVGEYTNAGGGVIAVFVDGNRTHAVVGTGKGAAASNTPLQFGRTLKSDGTGAKHLRGKIDEVRISNSLRYTANFTITSAHKDFVSDGTTVGLWKMNANTGTTTAVDSSANAYSATLHNGVLWRAGVTTNWVDKRPRRRTRARRSGVPLAGDAARVTEGGLLGRRGKADKTSSLVWEQHFEYDRWGNMTNQSGAETSVLTLTASKNQIETIDGAQCSYDNCGNLEREYGIGLDNTYSYDANNKMWKSVVVSTTTVTTTYVYNGLGQRVKKKTGGAETVFIYNAAGELVAEYESSARAKEYAYGPAGLLAVVQNPGAGEAVEYTTADHLGTPRVITTAAGALQTRHDYFPFGKEIPGTIAYYRTVNEDYPSNPHNIRQEFTSKERDAETGLDYFGARYYGSSQGRFTSVDPLLSSGHLADPQTWNRFTYTLNNPLAFTDPTGLFTYAKGVTDDQKKAFEQALVSARENLEKIGKKYGTDSGEYNKVKRALDAYGDPNKDNGVVVTVSDKIANGETTVNGKTITVAFNPSAIGRDTLAGHEGSHVADAKDFLATGNSPTKYQFEYDGLYVQALIGEAKSPENTFHLLTAGTDKAPAKQVDVWNPGWKEADVATLRSKGINEFLAIPKKEGGPYELKPGDTTKAFVTVTRRRRR